jgi:hypothetical protein
MLGGRSRITRPQFAPGHKSSGRLVSRSELGQEWPSHTGPPISHLLFSFAVLSKDVFAGDHAFQFAGVGAIDYGT